jgi:hypothetical protein
MYRRGKRYGDKDTNTPLKMPYMISNPHDDSEPSPKRVGAGESKWLQIASIDPAIYNCGLRIERRYYVDGILQVKTYVQVRMDFSTTDDIYKSCTEILTAYLPQLSLSHYILVESQLPINYGLVRMSQHIITLLSIRLANVGMRPLIVEIDPKCKTHFLNAPKKMDKPTRKKWACIESDRLLRSRGEVHIADTILTYKKRDDHGDVICFCEAWWIMGNGFNEFFHI